MFNLYNLIFSIDRVVLLTYLNFSDFSCYYILDFFYFYFLEFILFCFIFFSFFVSYKKYRFLKYWDVLFIILLSFLAIIFIKLILTHFCYKLDLHFIHTYYTLWIKSFFIIMIAISFYICKIKYLESNLLLDIICIYSFMILFFSLLFSVSDFFVAYMIIEGLSFIIYTLGCLINLSYINLESILKYFIINSLGSVLLLWSIGYLFLICGTTDFFEVQYIFMYSLEEIIDYYLHLICCVILISFLLKLGFFPFHWWVPDIYEGFWTPVTILYGVIVKIGFLFFFLRLVVNVFYPIIYLLQIYFFIAGVGSILWGTLGSVVQVKLKRFLGYASIVHSGYIMLGLGLNSLNGTIVSFMYIVSYGFISLGFFSCFISIEHSILNKNPCFFSQLYMLIYYNRETCFHLLILVSSMAAIPPFSNFCIKFFLYQTCIDCRHECLIVAILIISLISIYYYLNFIQQFVFLQFSEYKLFLFHSFSILNYILRCISFLLCIGVIGSILFYSISYNIILTCYCPITRH